MLNYYLANRAVWEKYVPIFRDSGCTDHENGAIVLVARFRTAQDQDAFEAEPGITPFPRLHANAPIGAALAATLNGFANLKPLGIAPTDTTFDAAMKLRKHFPPFDPRRE